MSNLPEGQTLAAEYTKTAKGAFLDLTIIDARFGSRHQIARDIRVSGKREALKVAKAHGATPWNF